LLVLALWISYAYVSNGGVGKGAQSGVLIKNAEALENMNKVNVLITDKTGTITEGKPSVEKSVALIMIKIICCNSLP
jgi:P-type E1-E2 ATPase